MTKKEAYKLKPGTVVEVKWIDEPNSRVMVLEKPGHETGDLRISCFPEEAMWGKERYFVTYIYHDQIVRVVGTISWPE